MDQQEVGQHVIEAPVAQVSQCIDWYHEGEERIVEVGGIRVVVRYVGRNGRRARIAIVAPAGAIFRSGEPRRTVRARDRAN